MTIPVPGLPVDNGVIDGIDVDAVAAAVRGCAGVSALDAGPYREVATYLPGRTVDGIAVGGGRVRVQVRSRWGVQAPMLATSIKTVLVPLTGGRPVDVRIADIDDPPDPGTVAVGLAQRSRPSRPPRPSPGLPPN